MSDVTNTFYHGSAFNGYGSQLMVGNGASPEVFEAIADIESITPGAMTTSVIDKTHLRSTQAHREKLVGLRDSGPFVLKGNWRPTHESQSNAGGGSSAFASGGLIAIWRNRLTKNFRIVLSDGSPGTIWPFTGAITKFTPGEIGIDSKVGFDCEITPLQDFSASLP